MISMLPKYEIEKIYDDVERRYEDYFIKGPEDSSLSYIFEKITYPCGVRTGDLKKKKKKKKLEITFECCQKLNIDTRTTYYILQIWSAYAPILLGLEKPLPPEKQMNEDDISF